MVPSIAGRAATASLLPRESTARRALRSLVHLVGWPFRMWAARQNLAQLAGMSEHELRDIGLTRQDLYDVSGYPLDQDPTAVLSSRVAARRRYMRPR